MKKLPMEVTRILLFIIVTICLVSTGIVTAEDTESQLLTPEEIERQKAMQPELTSMIEVDGMDVPLKDYAATAPYALSRNSNIPGSYDMRIQQGYASNVAVRNQGDSGLCWAFTAATVAEIAYYHEYSSSANIDLSPKRFGYFFYNRVNDPLGNTANDKNVIMNGQSYVHVGGNNLFSFQALANWGGLAAETEAFNIENTSYPNNTAYNNSIVLEYAEVLSSDEDVKAAIQKNGAIMVSMCFEDEYYSDYNTANVTKHYAYYCGTSRKTNHAVTIVGWDDSFSKANFKSLSGDVPAENGAWIVLNSWGSEWGDGGYFYVSYEDMTLRNAVSLNMQPVDTYDYNYQYDGNAAPIELTSDKKTTADDSYNVGLKEGAQIANIYEVEGSEVQNLEAVGITNWGWCLSDGTYGPEASYTVDIYTGLQDGTTNPESGTHAYSFTDATTATHEGFYTIKLPQAVTLQPYTNYSVVVTLNTEGSRPGIESDMNNGGMAFKCGYNSGQSFFSDDGSSNWEDLSAIGATARIKAYTSGTGTHVDPPETSADRIFKTSKSVRYGGLNRYETALKIANAYKTANKISSFDAVIVAYANDYPDALSGSYLAEVKKAPILLVGKNAASETEIRNYIKANLKSKGQVYLLGGTGVVSSSFQQSLSNLGYQVTRLGGNDRYETNLRILKAAGVKSEDILICTGLDYADSLSASAVGKPIMIVGSKLTNEQRSYIAGLSGNRFYLIGGSGVVSNYVANQLAPYGSVSRVWGATRYETSTAVAKTFFKKGDTEAAILAYALDFPDGLSGGPLALSLDCPLILTDNNRSYVARNCIKELGITKVAVLGGAALISDGTVNYILK